MAITSSETAAPMVLIPTGKGRTRAFAAVKVTKLRGKVNRFRVYLENGRSVVARRSPQGQYVVVGRRPDKPNRALAATTNTAATKKTGTISEAAASARHDRLLAILEMEDTGRSRRGVR